MLLTLDRGNTTLDGLWHADPSLRRRIDPSDAAAVAELLRHPERSDSRSSSEAVEAIGVSSVVGGLAAVATRLAEQGGSLRVAGEDLSCPLALDYPDPTTLGADRWVGALAAHSKYGAAITVDCGTAVTVNAVDATGVFRGGAIAPGARTMAAGLAAAAPRLPAVAWAQQLSMPGRDSEAAVDLGVQLGFCGLVERLVQDLRAAVDLESATLVVTGGDAEIFLAHTAQATAHHPDLIHQGLRELWERTRSNC